MDLNRLAVKIAAVYEQHPHVEAVLLGGSVSRNWQDSFSDIELYIWWQEAPSDRDRMAPIKKLNGSLIDFHPYEDEEWAETYTVNHVKLEISNFLTKTIQRTIYDVVKCFDTNLDNQCLAAAVHNGISLSGEHVITSLKKQVSHYPEALRLAMIKDHLALSSRWSNREALLAREDWLMLYELIIDVQKSIMLLLFGLNRQLVHHPGFKWQKQTLRTMTLTPANLAERFESVFLKHPNESINELEIIIAETYDLIERELPQLDVEVERQKSVLSRS